MYGEYQACIKKRYHGGLTRNNRAGAFFLSKKNHQLNNDNDDPHLKEHFGDLVVPVLDPHRQRSLHAIRHSKVGRGAALQQQLGPNWVRPPLGGDG